MLLGVSDPYAALCLDNACSEFGGAVESALREVTGKTTKEIKDKSVRVLNKWLGLKQQYRSPSPAQIEAARQKRSEVS